MVGKHDLRSHFRWLRIREFTQEWQTKQWFVKFQWICTFEPQNCSTLKSLKMMDLQSLESSKNRLETTVFRFQLCDTCIMILECTWVYTLCTSLKWCVCVCVILLVFPSYKLGYSTPFPQVGLSYNLDVLMLDFSLFNKQYCCENPGFSSLKGMQ